MSASAAVVRKEIDLAIPYKFLPLLDPHRYKVYHGGRGGAKSWNYARALLYLGLQKRLRILCTREIQNTIADSVHRILVEQAEMIGLEDFYGHNDTSIWGRNGTEFLFRGLKHNPDGLKSFEGADICWVEEAQSVSEESWDKLIPTIRKPGSEIWVSFNPDFPDDPTWKRFLVNPPPDCLVVEVSYMDNPELPEPLRMEAEHCRLTDPIKYQHIWLGGFGVRYEGRKVYTNFRRLRHVSSSTLKPIDAPVIRGWDNTGLHPGAVVTQVSNIGQWRILKEFQEEDCGIVDFGEAVQLWCTQQFGARTKYRDIGDPAGRNRDSNKKSPADYLKDKLNIIVEDGVQTFKIRREAIDGRLTKAINGDAPGILIDPGCTLLIDGFEGGYAYPEIGRSGAFKEEPAKNKYADVHDALQYPATRLFLSPERKAAPPKQKYQPNWITA